MEHESLKRKDYEPNLSSPWSDGKYSRPRTSPSPLIIIESPEERLLAVQKRYEEQLLALASEAMDYYNSNHQIQFELVKPLYVEKFQSSFQGLYNHLSFIGRSKGSSSSPKLKLFFAEVHSHDLDGYLVKSCTTVEPGNPLFPIGCEECHPDGVIYHPMRTEQEGGIRYHDRPPKNRMSTRESSAKKYLCEAYDFSENIEDFNADEDEELRKMIIGYATEAVVWYNGVYIADFELLKPVASVFFRDLKSASSERYAKNWLHVTFQARDKAHGLIDASSELFFAELCLDLNRVIYCSPVASVSGVLDSGIETSCAVCREVCPMPHPKIYLAGRCGGTFIDAQVEKRSWGSRVVLEPKLGSSSETDWLVRLANFSTDLFTHIS